jgi:alpha-tubulin suppressor-like RCC1 family protein
MMNAGHHDGLWRLALLALLKPCLLLAIASGALYGLPALSEGPRVHPVDVAVGWGQSCILGDNGHVWCWGNKLLNGQAEDTATPTRVQGIADIRKIAAGRLGTCAIDASRKVICWGSPYALPVTDGKHYTVPEAPRAFAVILSGEKRIIDIGLGAFSGCAVFENGQMDCWDYNDKPKPVSDFEGVERISMDSQTRGCALLRAGGPAAGILI